MDVRSRLSFEVSRNLRSRDRCVCQMWNIPLVSVGGREVGRLEGFRQEEGLYAFVM